MQAKEYRYHYTRRARSGLPMSRYERARCRSRQPLVSICLPWVLSVDCWGACTFLNVDVTRQSVPRSVAS